jgi:hypothetical protein
MRERAAREPHGQRPRVLVAVFDPVVPALGQRLSQACGFQAPDGLLAGYCADLAWASRGYLRYQLVETVWADRLPALEDGFSYHPEEWLHCWQRRGGWHQPAMADYPALVERLGVLPRIARGELDEVWCFGPPYAGFWESAMVGPEAWWCNAPPVPLAACPRRFIVMGFNYERGVGEMLESFGHRVEACVARAFGSWREWGGRADHAWDRFTAYDQVAPGRAGCGTVHRAPNSTADYDWGNPRAVWSDCDDWLHYPDARGRWRLVTCREWGGGDIRAHHRWWLRHLPCAPGTRAGHLNNWWRYALLEAGR